MRTTLPPGVLPPVNWTHFNDELLCCVFALLCAVVLSLASYAGASEPRDQQCAAGRVVQRTRVEHDASWT